MAPGAAADRWSHRGTTSAALEALFADHGEEIAAVITEPVLGNGGAIMPAPGYLERMRELTSDAGALLIFDEVMTGYRVAAGGAQELLGIDPDLTVLAKALGAGFPVAALGGKREVMELAANGGTMHGGTYNSNPLVCAAVIAAAAETGADGFYDRLHSRGRRLAEGPAPPWRARPDSPAGLLERCGRHVPALVLGRAAPRLPRGSRDRRGKPVLRPARRTARARRDNRRPRRGSSCSRRRTPTTTSTRCWRWPRRPCRPVAAAADRGEVWTEGGLR